MRSLSGHIGARVSALVDGQLSPDEEERAWAHVLTCPGCRRLVQHEGWTKQRLGALADPVEGEPPSQLLGSLYAVDAWAAVDEIEQRSTRRRTTAVLVGGGAVGAAVLGLVAVTGPSLGRGDVPTRPSPATIRNDTTRTPVGSSPGWSRDDALTSVAWVRRTR